MRIFLAAFTALLITVSVSAQPGKGTAAPDIQLPNTKGVVTTLTSLKGKVVLVDFWASWCGPCRRAMPALRELYKKYNKKGFEIYAISLDTEKDSWKTAIFEDGSKWLHVIDVQGDVASKWNVQYIPNSFLISKDGKVITVNADEAELESQLKKLLG